MSLLSGRSSLNRPQLTLSLDFQFPFFLSLLRRSHFVVSMIHSFAFCISFLVIWPSLNLALPLNSSRGDFVSWKNQRGFELPIQRRVVRSESSLKRSLYSGSTGLGDFLDLYGPTAIVAPLTADLLSRFYTVAITVGETATAVNIGALTKAPSRTEC